MKIDFNESDLLREILNFKIIDRRYIEEKYSFKNLDYTLDNLNNFLLENDNSIIHKDKNHFFYFGKYNEDIFKIEDREINTKMTFRRELITLILLFGNEKLNIYKFNKNIRRIQENNRNIQNDLRQVLKIFGINYSEYEKSRSIERLFEERGYDFKRLKENYLKEILSRRIEKNHLGKSTYQENLYFKIIEEILEVKNIRYIKKIIFSYIEKFTGIVSVNEKYVMLTYFLLNIQNREIKSRYNVKRSIENEEFFIMMDKIFKKEKIKENSKFVTMFYKKLHKNRKNVDDLINTINAQLLLEKNTKPTGLEKLKLEKFKQEGRVKVYDIAETSVNFEDENLFGKQIVKRYVHVDKVPKIPTLILFDLEENEIMKVFGKIRKIFNFVKIVKVEHLKNFKKFLPKGSRRYEQILLISSSKFINVIKNFSDTPIYHFEVEKERGALKSRANFLVQMIYMRTAMIKYLEFKQERKIFSKKIRK
ncbi:hypothetical protein [Leptotrichia sp. oral taxon 879]|uniref:Uncharacterized protein n=1 Tax=Leptotrichia mesophila TaxID=3239303 RepID=A0AB39VCE0_9FUSO|nr:hypothetical protein [Leptotrichia sp. oral taxon 879]ERK48294.1 hypothetical protein HMPREF1552_02126 [Leptotrichia sp. oral taxon 879 str. F0557]